MSIAQSHQNRLGCSEIAAALGLSPWKTANQLWEEKTGRHEPDDLSGELRIKLGHRLEQVVADLYAEQTGLAVVTHEKAYLSDTLPLIGHIDRAVLDGVYHGLEIKTSLSRAGAYGWGMEGTDGVPDYYLTQCMGYLMLTGWQRWDLAVLLAGPELRIYRIYPDAELIDAITAGICCFWEHVTTDVPPPIATLEDADRRWPSAIQSADVATPALTMTINQLRDAKRQLKTIQAEIDALELAIKTGIGPLEGLLGQSGKPLCTWKSTSRQTLDQKALAAAHPELYQQFLKTTTSRAFRLC